jgi:mRNA interferase RelE/StbE
VPPLKIQFSDEALKYVKRLDRPTKERIAEELGKIAKDPFNPTLSILLRGNTAKRRARVGSYRLILLITTDVVLVTDVAPRGQVYKDLRASG